MPEIGDRIPQLSFTLSTGAIGSFADYSEHWLALYFYPKDSTPGCTTEGNDFNALLPQFKRAGATVVGVSRDSVKSHQNFCAKQGFKFDLISDGDEAICKAFDVIKPKKLYGREYIGIVRSTFLIDTNGLIRAIWSPVKVPGHAEAVLAELKLLRKAK